MIALLSAIGRRAPLVLVAGVVLGLILPGFGAILGPALQILVVMLLAVAMIRVDLPQVLAHLRRPWHLGLLLFFLMAALPLAVHGLAIMLGLSAELHMALVLVACAPPLASAPAMAVLLELDDALVLNVMVVGTLLVPLSAPVLAVSLLDLPVELDAGAFLLRLSVTIGLAVSAASMIRRGLGRRRIETYGEVLDGVSALIMVLFAIVVMNGVGVTQLHDPWRLMGLLGAVMMANWGLHALTAAAFCVFQILRKSGKPLLSRQDGAIALMAGNRNLALFLAALPTETAGSLLLFLALAQIPIYLTPIVAAPLYRRFYRR